MRIGSLRKDLHLRRVAEAHTASGATTLVIQRGTLIDGTGKPRAQNPVSGDRFKAVGISGQTAIPPNSQIIDIKGKTVLPGFIDGHAHWEGFENEIYLHVGITSIANIQPYQSGPGMLTQRDGMS